MKSYGRNRMAYMPQVPHQIKYMAVANTHYNKYLIYKIGIGSNLRLAVRILSPRKKILEKMGDVSFLAEKFLEIVTPRDGLDEGDESPKSCIV